MESRGTGDVVALKWIRPRLGSTRPLMQLSSVDFPPHWDR